MSLDELTGRRYGPVDVRIDPGKVRSYVEATGDDPDRWQGAAPPSFAGALLFAVAPMLLADPQVASRFIIHAEQTFTWHRPIETGRKLEVTGHVERVRVRGDVAFVTFAIVAGGEAPWVEGRSTFIASAPGTPAVARTDEPPVDRRGPNEQPVPLVLPKEGAPVEPMVKSASRSDLVRYAGASHDWNAIHWDHATAVAAGLEGVIVHGLLEAAWAVQAAARYSPFDRPLTDARFRFKAPLRPATPVAVQGVVAASEPGATRLQLALADATTIYVTADVGVVRE